MRPGTDGGKDHEGQHPLEWPSAGRLLEHGVSGKGTDIVPKLAGSHSWININGSLESIKGLITNGVPHPKHGVAMPPMGGAQLTSDQIDALAAYVYSISHPKK
jgi:mono/diheme cytochrome c family protein